MPSLRRPLPNVTNPNTRIFLLTYLGFAISGAIVGLIVGSFTYLPTAPVAMLELGIPSALLGCVVGGAAVGIHIIWRHLVHHS